MGILMQYAVGTDLLVINLDSIHHALLIGTNMQKNEYDSVYGRWLQTSHQYDVFHVQSVQAFLFSPL